MTTKPDSERKQKRRHGTATLLPVDFALLAILPDEGKTLGLKPIAVQVKPIANRPEFEGFTSNQLAGRLKSMQYQGLVVTQVTLPLQAGLGWQRTAKGKEVLAKNGRVVS